MPGPGSTLGHHDGFVDQWAEAARRRARLQFGALVVIMAASAAGLAVLASQAQPIPADPAFSGPKPEDRSPTVRVEVPTAHARSDPAPSPAPRVSAHPPSTAIVRRHSMLGPSNLASQPLAARVPVAPHPVLPSKENPPADPVAFGREIFARRWKPNDPRSHGGDGLGPVYNADSCLACHFQAGAGGAGPAEVNVTLITKPSKSSRPSCPPSFERPISVFEGRKILRPVNGPEEWAVILPAFARAPSLVMHHFGVDPAYSTRRAALLELANDPTWKEINEFAGLQEALLAQRNTPPLFGTGLIDAVPERVLLEEEARQRQRGESAGRAHRMKDGRIGRFGWKAQSVSLDDFVRGACANELGLEVPGQHQAEPAVGRTVEPAGLDLSAADCDALTAYIRQLPAPSLRPWTGSPEHDAIQAGRRAFEEIGCAECHTPSLGGIDGIYSDLLLHDMGLALASFGSSYGATQSESLSDPAAARDAEWRTPPLWGLAASAPYLHDGRARTIEEAIAAHGAQGNPASQNFFLQTAARREQILAFLKALAPPPPDRHTPGVLNDTGPALAADPSVGRWRGDLENFSQTTLKNSVDFAHFGVSSKLDVAKNLARSGKRRAALETYRKLIGDHPGSVEARFARERIATLERK